MMLSKTNRKIAAMVGAALSIGITAYVMYDMVQETQEQYQHVSELNEILHARLNSESYGYAAINQQGIVVAWNRALEIMTGYTHEEMIGGTLEKLMRPEDWEQHRPKFRATMALSKDVWEKRAKDVLVIKCVVKPKKENEIIELRVNIRLYEIGLTGNRYADAHIDKQENVEVINTISPETKAILTHQKVNSNSQALQ
jgi:PAS domain S-box-containing protein